MFILPPSFLFFFFTCNHSLYFSPQLLASNHPFLRLSRRAQRPHEEHLQQPEGDNEPGRHGPGRHPQLLPGLPAVHPAVHAGAGGATAGLPRPQCCQLPRGHRENAAAQLRRWILERNKSKAGKTWHQSDVKTADGTLLSAANPPQCTNQ